MDSGINIIDLNLDVLDIIFSELIMKDQINLGFAHANLREAFLFHNRSLLKKMVLGCFPSEIWDSLLSLCGYMVESLVLESYDLLLALNCAAKHCKSLQKLTFTMAHRDNSYEVRSWLCTLTSLNSICIRQGSLSIHCVEYLRITQWLPHLPNLRKLQLINFPNLALIPLRELTQLEELYIFCWRHSPIDIGYICAQLKNLRVLNFKGTIGDSFQDLPELCPLLEKLTLCTRNIKQTPYFPKLKELTIDIKSDPIAHALGECGPRYAKQLNKLTIHTKKPIENDELLEQLRGIKYFEML